MTIERLAVFSGETRTLTDVTFGSGGSGMAAPSSLQAKTGSYSYRQASGRPLFGKGLVAGISAVRMGYWQYMAQLGIDGYHASAMVVLYYAGNARSTALTSNHIAVVFDPSEGLIRLHRPDAGADFELLATAALPSVYLTTGSWFHVGITHKIDSGDGFLSVYINGTRVLNYQGDTRPSSGGIGNEQTFQETAVNYMVAGLSGISTGFTEAYVDDVYLDSYADEPDAPVPSRRFLMALPDGVGADAAWTPIGGLVNWQNVDDNPNTADTDYNKALAANLRDTFTYSNITLPVDHRIVAVLPSPFARRLDSEIDHKLSVHAWDGLQYLDSADIDLSMAYDVPVFARFTTQPDGSLWNETDFNAMQFGYRSRGVF